MFNSRAKGSAAELDVAARLQEWWRQVEPGCRFKRTPLSGGWGTGDDRAGFRASGDLMTTAERFPWAIEVKRREGWAWKPLLAGGKSPVWGWWLQAQAAAGECGLLPMMWLRHNREPWHVMVRAYCPRTEALLGPLRGALRHEWDFAELMGRDAGFHPVLLVGEEALRLCPRSLLA